MAQDPHLTSAESHPSQVPMFPHAPVQVMYDASPLSACPTISDLTPWVFHALAFQHLVTCMLPDRLPQPPDVVLLSRPCLVVSSLARNRS